ncbi:MAG: hypothetical protein D6685_02485 [Bacteroidetes bacterium]|nr:hypothetical protein AWN76_009100 [Rhodothermaceae bacterium RA]RMH68230.1 MAG: hypothetical protein D6685_02485 [Bacteroidota bacterium]
MQPGDRVSVHAGPALTFDGALCQLDEVSGYVFVVSDDGRRAAWVHRGTVLVRQEGSEPAGAPPPDEDPHT